tara:strand:+ start:3960 stop:5036 length:1077 start_codon:yes stop_codon:yes gene_type:complete
VSRILFTGGGSAGHVIPALPVVRACLDRGDTVDFIGSHSGLEQRLVEGMGVRYHGITTGKLRRYFSVANLVDAFRVLGGCWQAFRMLGRISPDVVFSKGGFVSFPVVIAAWLRRIPVVAHESDYSPGLANRLSMPFIEVLCTNFLETCPARFKGRVVHSGTPVRRELMEGSAVRARERLGVPPDRGVLVVTGGSLGADALNAVVREALDALLKGFDVVHVCGEGKATGLKQRGYHEFEYVGEGWGDLLAAADVVVSRAGANALFELLTLAKPMLLVPLPARASRGDQIENAEFARVHGYAEVIAESELDAASLCECVEKIFRARPDWLRSLERFERPQAEVRLVQVLDDVLGKGEALS